MLNQAFDTEEIIAKALELDVQDSEAWMIASEIDAVIAQLYYPGEGFRGQLDLALKDIQQALDEGNHWESRSPMIAYSTKGFYLQVLGRDSEAIEAYEKAMDLLEEDSNPSVHILNIRLHIPTQINKLKNKPK